MSVEISANAVKIKRLILVVALLGVIAGCKSNNTPAEASCQSIDRKAGRPWLYLTDTNAGALP
jgi:hypothetical protein